MKFFIAGIFLTLSILFGCSKPESDAVVQTSEHPVVKQLQITEKKIGAGKEAGNSMRVAVHYTGWLYDENAADKKGLKFDSSLDRKRPLVFSLGNKDVIQGWEEGLQGMKPGGLRTLIIPPHMGYGAKGYPPTIPPGAALVFEIELLQAG